MQLVVWLAVGTICGLLCGSMAKSKNQSYGVFFALGFLFGILPMFILMFISDAPRNRMARGGRSKFVPKRGGARRPAATSQVECSSCGKRVMASAAKCRFCGATFVD